MTLDLRRDLAALILGLGMLTASSAGANTPIRVDVERAAVKAYVVDADFDVDAPSPVVWEVLTDYEGISKFVSSVRQSTVKQREPGLARAGMRGIVRRLLEEVRHEILARVAR